VSADLLRLATIAMSAEMLRVLSWPLNEP